MNSSVVKNIAKFFYKFNCYIKSEDIKSSIRKHPCDFTRVYKFPWYDVLYYLIFRTEKCAQAEITKYFCDIGKPDSRISKQAMFKAIKKVNPDVFLSLIHKFTELFYKTDLVKTYKDYVLLAEDGTCNELRPSKKSLDSFGYVLNQFISNKDNIRKATSRSAALYDITNGLIIDFSMNPYKKSEIPIAIEHLEKSHQYFKNQKVIYLCDRYYGSIELFSILEGYGFKYCVRAKCNFFKKQISQMKTDDEWITVTVDKNWLKRLKYEQPKKRFEADPTIRIRVVKYHYVYYDKKGIRHSADLMYFTNLSEDEFSSMDIVELYAKRWDIECSYKTLKTDYEWERFFSSDCDTEVCSILAKVLFHNINGIIRKELNVTLSQESVNPDVKYTYTVNIVQLSKLLHNNHLCRYIRNNNKAAIERILKTLLDLINKIKVPVRPNRHSKRWGRRVKVNRPTRFRLDGRNWPNIAIVQNHVQTVKP